MITTDEDVKMEDQILMLYSSQSLVSLPHMEKFMISVACSHINTTPAATRTLAQSRLRNAEVVVVLRSTG